MSGVHRGSVLLWRRCDTLCFVSPPDLTRQNSLSITERRVPELIPVLGSQPAGDVNHKPGGRLPLLSAMQACRIGHYMYNNFGFINDAMVFQNGTCVYTCSHIDTVAASPAAATS